MKGLDGRPQLEVRIPDRRPVRAELTPQLCVRIGGDLSEAAVELIDIDANEALGPAEPVTDDPLGNVAAGASGLAQDESDPADEQPVEVAGPEQPSASGEASEGAAAPQTEQPQVV
ncbi:MAG: hypothetical protein ACKVWV_20370 [Planctomycetota bacterium]